MSNPERVLICAHRGASAAHPDNTIAAFEGARGEAADWVELDVRRARDGALVVSHDAWYQDGRSVWATPADERPDGVLLLDAALDACAGMAVNVEIKNSPGDLGEVDGEPVGHDLTVADEVVAFLAGRDGTQRYEISSFDESTLQRVRSLEPRIPTAYLVFDLAADPTIPERAAAAGDVAVNPWDPLVDAAFMQRCGELGLQVNAWTVDDPMRIVELARLGVHSIITNEPANARSVLVAAGLL